MKNSFLIPLLFLPLFILTTRVKSQTIKVFHLGYGIETEINITCQSIKADKEIKRLTLSKRQTQKIRQWLINLSLKQHRLLPATYFDSRGYIIVNSKDTLCCTEQLIKIGNLTYQIPRSIRWIIAYSTGTLGGLCLKTSKNAYNNSFSSNPKGTVSNLSPASLNNINTLIATQPDFRIIGEAD